MNKADPFEMLKGGGFAGLAAWLKQVKLISFGVVLEVIDAQTVRVAETVRTGVSERSYFATLLTPSSALLEVYAAPQPGDLVLLLFFQKWNTAMFGLHREPRDAVVYDEKAGGYSRAAAAAILLTPPKGHSAVSLRFGGTAEEPELSAASLAEVYGRFRGAFSVFFDGEEEAPVSLLYGKRRPLRFDHWGTALRRHGFIADTVEKTLLETDAAVTEEYSVYAPIRRNVQGSQTAVIGLGTDPGGDPEGAPVETEAPVTAVVHGKSPVEADIRSPVAVKIGFGNAESEDPSELRDAPVRVAAGEKSPVTVSIQGPLTTDVGLGTDPHGDAEGSPVETEAPVTAVIHGKSPVLKDIRSPVTVRVGLGNAESGSGTEARDAPVDATLGEKAPITLSSASGMTLHFDKPVSVDGKETCDLTFTGKITVTGEDQITVEAGAKIFIGNNVQNIYDVLVGLVEQVKNLVTFGHPGIHKVAPASKAALDLYRRQYIEPVFTPSK